MSTHDQTTKSANTLDNTVEARRVADAPREWKAWGPFLAERQWGTVREDYSEGGNAWEYFPHDHARSRVYRWGEDGLAGVCDRKQRLCLSLALHNGNDAILKERLFGLTNSQGNHGEDLKELYYYLDAAPSHSYLRSLYKYPQAAFPYAELVDENGRRSATDPEYELLDTGVFDDDRYFDVVVEYAQSVPGDISMRVTVTNRGPERADITVVPQLWFRNEWRFRDDVSEPRIERVGPGCVSTSHVYVDDFEWQVDPDATLLFCDNENHAERLWNTPGAAYPKDAFHRYIVDGELDAVRPADAAFGTKCGAVHSLSLASGASESVVTRLTRRDVRPPAAASTPKDVLAAASLAIDERLADLDDYYAALQHHIACADRRLVQRQALAGLVYSKQYYRYDLRRWLKGDPGHPPPPPGRNRNSDWDHLYNSNVLLMPDAWEYPWYAAWDLAFHCVPMALIDPVIAKRQLVLLTREWYMHPNGQIPAYEWAFSDVNPPVHGWAAWRVFCIDRDRRRAAQKRAAGQKPLNEPPDPGDLAFLERVFHKLMLNFTWWVNRKDAEGRNVFQGGFLGLDNIAVFDRSHELPTGGHLEQADGTSWMAMYSLNLMRIALELALHNPVYEDIASKFFEHFLHIAEAMTNMGGDGIGLWDEEDGFFYDVLRCPDGERVPLKVRSIVGLAPLFAVEVLEPELLDALPGFKRRMEWVFRSLPHLSSLVSRFLEPGRGEVRLLSLLRRHRLRALLRRMLDPDEFLSDYGVRALSKGHEAEPYVFEKGDVHMAIGYEPGESQSTVFGGNSNWRGPIWFPVNFLLIDSLRRFHDYYGDAFTVDMPTRDNRTETLTLDVIADRLSERLIRLFLADENGRRPTHGYHDKLAADPHFRDHILFHEYFHGDDGHGLGASHQTGWTALVASLIAGDHHTAEPAAAGEPL